MISRINAVWKECETNLTQIRKAMKEFPDRFRAVTECNGNSIKMHFAQQFASFKKLIISSSAKVIEGGIFILKVKKTSVVHPSCVAPVSTNNKKYIKTKDNFSIN